MSHTSSRLLAHWFPAHIEDGVTTYDPMRQKARGLAQRTYILKNGITAVNELNYDWVFFDYGKTLTAEPAGTGNKSRVANRTGKALRQWFEMIGEDVGTLDAETLEGISADAHRNTPGSAGQNSIVTNTAYYSRWFVYIYRALGIQRDIPLAEREAAMGYVVWQSIACGNGSTGPRTIQTLKTLKQAGLRLGVISNNNGYVEDMLRCDGVYDLFEIVIDSSRVEFVKPDWRIFDKAAGLTGTPNARFLYVGDDHNADVIGASGFGWDVAWIDDKHEGQIPAGATVHPIHAITELVEICGVKA